MIFRDRLDAGERLAGLLSDYRGEELAIIAIPRGGVEVGYILAVRLGAPLEVTAPRKIGAPMDPELAVGAVAEDGTIYVDEEIAGLVGVSWDWIKSEGERELREVRRRIEKYRGGKLLPRLEKYIVILVDDGVATGATIIATARFLRKLGARRLVIAVPVAPPETLSKLARESDDVRCIETPTPFFAIGQFYYDFSQLSDDQVLDYLMRVKRLV